MFKALCLFRDQFNHIKPVEEALRGKVEFKYDDIWDSRLIIGTKPDIVIGINEYHLKIAECYFRSRQLNIPSLTLQDGIMEWRHVFENPLYNGNEHGVPLYHPVIADKIACIGPIWYNFIKELGNEKKVELTGMPKMDILGNRPTSSAKKQVKKILILTSAKPWFYDDQKPVIIQMLSDLKEFFMGHNNYIPIWRVTKHLDRELGLINHFAHKDTLELKELLNDCDAVISTISTAMIESMLCGKPVARIDYFNNPALFPTVWNITDKNQIEDQVLKLANPSQMECWLQDVYKNQVILATSHASKNVAELILLMISFSKSNSISDMPADMYRWLPDDNLIQVPPSLSEFYPARNVYQTDNIDELRNKLIRAELEISTLNNQLARSSLSVMIMRKFKTLKTKLFNR